MQVPRMQGPQLRHVVSCKARQAAAGATAHASRRPQLRRSATAATMQEQAAPTGVQTKTHLCTSLTAPTVDGMLAEAQEALAAGADIVELRIDFLETLDAERDLPRLLSDCPLPAIVTYRPDWEA